MAEVLAVIAIIGVMMALLFPAVFQLQHDLRAMQLDESAHQVYNVVQGRLTSLSASGRTSDLEAKIKDLGGTRVTAAPSDYAFGQGDSTSWDDYRLYHVSSTDDVVSTYLVTSESASLSRDLLSGSYVVELSPSTGEVYAVFYWEGDASSPTGSFDYDTLNMLRSADARHAALVGYYGGNPIREAAPLDDDHHGGDDDTSFGDLDISVVNAEELYCCFKSTSLGAVAADPDVLKTLKITVTVTGTSSSSWGGTSTWQRTYTPDSADPSTRINLTQGDDEFDVILDSMRDGLRFKDIVGDILPGSNLKIQLALYCDVGQDDPAYTPLKSYEADNVSSLFGSYASDTKTVEVSSVRHLRNLDLSDAMGKSESDASGLISNFVNYSTINVTSDIDFDGTTWEGANAGCVSVQSRIDSAGNGYNPTASIAPLKVAETMTSQSTNTINGNGHVLANFHIVQGATSNGTSNAGLWSDLYNSVADLLIEDPVVSGGDNVGALTGLLRGGTIDNVHVYSAASDVDQAVGHVSGTGSNVGGLVGAVTAGGLTIKDCSSSVAVSGAGTVGGLVGDARQLDLVQDCSVGYTKGDASRPFRIEVSASQSGDYAGGAFGQAGGVINGCKTLVRVFGRNYVGGVAGYVEGGRLGANRTTGDLATSIYTVVSGSGDYVGGIAGRDSAGSSSGDVAYASVQGGNYVGGLVGYFQGVSYAGGLVTSGAASSRDEALWVQSTTGGSYVGGGFGRQDSDVRNCTAQVNVSGRNNVGGLVGYSTGSIDHGAAHANVLTGGTTYALSVLSDGDFAGGLVGRNASGGITNSFAAADVDNTSGSAGGRYYGGFVGCCDQGTIQSCYASGDVRAYGYVGGFGGYRADGWWNQNFATGDVRATDDRDAAAFVGADVSSQSMSQCAAYGSYTAYDGTVYGKFVGYTQQTHAYGSWTNDFFVAYGNVADADYQPDGGAVTLAEAPERSHWIWSATASETHAFSGSLAGRTFPFYTIAYQGTGLPYYGDWPVA